MYENLKNVIANLPLILCETLSAKTVSFNRVLTAIVAFVVLVSPFVILFFAPQMFDKFIPIWEKLLAFLGVQTAGNILKKFAPKGGQS